MEEICNAFPKKTRYMSLEKVNMDGLHPEQADRLRVEFENLIQKGWSETEVVQELNTWADEIRTANITYEYQMRIRDEMMDKIKEELKDMPVPVPNMDGDVGMKRLKLFLNWLNDVTPALKEDTESISEVAIIQGCEDKWQDVVDIPVTVYNFDLLKPLRLFIIGGGEATQSNDGFWFFTG
jgi:hypothetical protein